MQHNNDLCFAGVATALRQSIGRYEGLVDQTLRLTRQLLRSPPHTDAIKRHYFTPKNFYEKVYRNYI